MTHNAFMPFFTTVQELPADPIFKLQTAFESDPRGDKVNLGIGAYKDSLGKSIPLASVQLAEKNLLESKISKDYLPIKGLQSYIDGTLELTFGEKLLSKIKDRIFSAQTVGGTSALRLAADFCRSVGYSTIFLPEQTWQNHSLVFQYAKLTQASYPYYDFESHTINFEKVLKSIERIPQGSLLLLHACCHNPTGCDFSREQWIELSSIIKEKGILPFFDMAYQGFGQSLQDDPFAVRLFAEQGHELILAYSYSKNMGLYNERIGSLIFLTDERLTSKKVGSHLKQFIRSNYSNSPAHGAQVVTTILQSEHLRSMWENELAAMRIRIKEMRETLISGLMAKGISNLNYLSRQVGLFSFIGLNPHQVARLREDFAIHMPENGRINVAGLNWNNVDYVVKAIATVL